MRLSTVPGLLMVPLLTGCGTMFNLGDEGKPYGGVRTDAMLVSQAPKAFEREPEIPGPCGPTKLPRRYWLWFGGLALIDLPLSFVGDTLTLPWTLPTLFESSVPVTDGPPPEVSDAIGMGPDSEVTQPKP